MKVLTELFLSFLKMGFFSIGGGYSMLPFIEDEVVRHGWMDIEELVNFLAVSESTPGSMSVNMACFVGLKTAKLPGLLAATLGVSLPSFGVMLLIAVFYRQFKVNKAVLSVLKGLQPTVTGLIASAIITVGISVFFPDRLTLSVCKTPAFYASLLIFLISYFLSRKKTASDPDHPHQRAAWCVCRSAVSFVNFFICPLYVIRAIIHGPYFLLSCLPSCPDAAFPPVRRKSRFY